MRTFGRRNRGAPRDVVSASGQLDCSGRRRRAGRRALGDCHARGVGGGWRHRQTWPVPWSLREPRAQTPHGSIRDDGDTGAGGVGRLAADGPQATVVLHRRCAGATCSAQAHTAPLLTTAAALQTEQTRPRQLNTHPRLSSDTPARLALHATRNSVTSLFSTLRIFLYYDGINVNFILLALKQKDIRALFLFN